MQYGYSVLISQDRIDDDQAAFIFNRNGRDDHIVIIVGSISAQRNISYFGRFRDQPSDFRLDHIARSDSIGADDHDAVRSAADILVIHKCAEMQSKIGNLRVRDMHPDVIADSKESRFCERK